MSKADSIKFLRQEAKDMYKSLTPAERINQSPKKLFKDLRKTWKRINKMDVGKLNRKVSKAVRG